MGKKGKWMSPASLSPICGCSKQKLSKPIMMGGAEEEPEFRRRIVKSASAATAIVTAPSIIFAVTNGSMETIYEVIYLVLFLEVLVLSLFPRTWDKKTYLLLHVSVVMRLRLRLLQPSWTRLLSPLWHCWPRILFKVSQSLEEAH